MTRTFGSITTLPSGSVRARYTGPDRRRYARVFPNDDVARAWLLAAQADIAYDRWEAPENARRDTPTGSEAPESTTVEDWAARWLEDLSRTRKPTTVQSHRDRLRRYVLPYVGSRVLAKMSRSDWKAWFDGHRKRASAGTHRTVYMTVTAMLNAAVEEEIVPELRLSVKGASAPPRKREVTVLTTAEIERLAASITPRLQLAVLLAAVCGLRLGEILGLQRGDIELENRRLRVRRSVSHIVGKGIVEHAPKSEGSMRTVPLPGRVMALLQDHLRTHAAKGGAKARVFPRPRSEGQLYEHQNTVRSALKQAAGESGVSCPGWHALRHTALTRYSWFATEAETMALGGHSDPRVAQAYRHSVDERTRSALDRLMEDDGGSAA